MQYHGHYLGQMVVARMPCGSKGSSGDVAWCLPNKLWQQMMFEVKEENSILLENIAWWLPWQGSQGHILLCPFLKDDDITPVPEYEGIFTNNQTKIKIVTQALRKKFAKFTSLKSSTVHGQSPKTKPSAAKPEDTVNNVDNIIVNVVNCSDLELE